MSEPTHDQGMLLMEYFKLWDTPLDGEAWTFFRRCAAEGVFDSYERFSAEVEVASHDYVLFDRVLCAYEQAATLMKHGLMHPSLYFETWPDATRVWARVEPVVRGIREERSSDAYSGLEWLAGRRQEWAAAA